MKKYKQSFLTFIIISLSFVSFGQKNYETGYIIFNNNDTLYGFVKDRKPEPFGKLYSKIRFKTQKKIFCKKYSAYDILGYKQNNRQYNSLWLDISGNLWNEEYKSISNLGEKIFLRIIISNYLSFYQLEHKDAETGYIYTIDLFKRTDETILIRVTQGIFGLKRKKLVKYFYDCPVLADKINNKLITDPTEIAIFYNNWKNNQY